MNLVWTGFGASFHHFFNWGIENHAILDVQKNLPPSRKITVITVIVVECLQVINYLEITQPRTMQISEVICRLVAGTRAARLGEALGNEACYKSMRSERSDMFIDIDIVIG